MYRITPEKFMEFVSKDGFGCWNWTGSLDRKGYGQSWHQNKYAKAHRLAYRFFKGELIDGLQIDHLCRNRKCVNPAHLEQVTAKENVLRGEGIPARNAKKNKCPSGHALTGDNLYEHRNKRYCRKCRQKQGRERREKNNG